MAAELTDEQIDALMTTTFNGKEVPQVWFQRADVRRIVRSALATQQATQGAEPVGEVILFGGKYLEVAWAKGRMPGAGSKLYTAPPSTAEVEKKAARYDGLRRWGVSLPPFFRRTLVGSDLDAAIDRALQFDQL